MAYVALIIFILIIAVVNALHRKAVAHCSPLIPAPVRKVFQRQQDIYVNENTPGKPGACLMIVPGFNKIDLRF